MGGARARPWPACQVAEADRVPGAVGLGVAVAADLPAHCIDATWTAPELSIEAGAGSCPMARRMCVISASSG